MEYIKLGQNEVSRLGFGCMRLPQKEGNIDYEKAEAMADYAINNGINYFDTAYVYHSGKSEDFIKRTLKKHGRDKIYIADKLPLWLCQNESDMQKILEEQLERLGTNYIDYYLLHALNSNTWQKCQDFNYQEFIERNIKEGKIKHIGFSFHDELKVFKEIIDAYKWDFCQIQFNYLDTEYQAGIAGYNYAKNKNIPTIIMEPIRGGSLAKLPEAVHNIFNTSNLSSYSDAHLALKYVANYDNNKVILSGMSNLENLIENIKLFNEPLTNKISTDELKLFDQAKKAFFDYKLIGCTKCDYCKERCPQSIYISELFTTYNNHLIHPSSSNFHWYADLENKASKCIQCGSCEKVCPQKIKIINHLKDINTFFTN